jgi:hypothetical protein
MVKSPSTHPPAVRINAPRRDYRIFYQEAHWFIDALLFKQQLVLIT